MPLLKILLGETPPFSGFGFRLTDQQRYNETQSFSNQRTFYLGRL